MEKKIKKKSKVIKIILIILLILILISVALGISAYNYYKKLVGLVERVDINKEEIEINEGVEKTLKGYKNIALFGLDSRKDDYGVGNRSDCIIIASINLDTKDIKLVSVYRDSYLEGKDGKLDKINHAYSYGGPALAISKLNKNLDLNITEFLTVNFSALVDIIDSLDGIEIEIDSSELKYINKYVRELIRVTGESSKEVTRTGKQKLNGIQAVAYSRIRYTEGGDYKRTERMRTVLEAILKKAKTKGIPEIMDLLEKFLPRVSTNMTDEEINSFVFEFKDYNISTSIGWPYEVKGITLDRWYGVPVTLEESVRKLHQEVFGEEEYEPSETVKAISNRIIEKTGYK